MYKKNSYALRRAIDLNDIEAFRCILLAEGWPKDSVWSDYHLLIKALKNNREEIAHFMLDNGARVIKSSVELRNNLICTVNTPLHYAVSLKLSLKLIEKLLDRGALVNVKNQDGDTPLHVAFDERASGETIDLILQKHLTLSKRINVRNKHGLRILHIACTRPDLNTVKRVFQESKNALYQVRQDSDKAYAGYTALHFAVDNGRYEVAEFLIKHGVGIDKQDRNKTTPLHLALKLREVRMIDLLLAHDKLKKNVVNKFGLSHFMVACAGSKLSVIKEYLEIAMATGTPRYDMITARVNEIKGCTGYTSFHFAVDLGQADNVEYLLGEGANCCDITVDDLTPHKLADRRGHENVCKILREHCDVMNACKATRSKEQDFGNWGDNYERGILNDRVKEIKMLRRTLDNLKIINDALPEQMVGSS